MASLSSIGSPYCQLPNVEQDHPLNPRQVARIKTIQQEISKQEANVIKLGRKISKIKQSEKYWKYGAIILACTLIFAAYGYWCYTESQMCKAKVNAATQILDKTYKQLRPLYAEKLIILNEEVYSQLNTVVANAVNRNYKFVSGKFVMESDSSKSIYTDPVSVENLQTAVLNSIKDKNLSQQEQVKKLQEYNSQFYVDVENSKKDAHITTSDEPLSHSIQTSPSTSWKLGNLVKKFLYDR